VLAIPGLALCHSVNESPTLSGWCEHNRDIVIARWRPTQADVRFRSRSIYVDPTTWLRDQSVVVWPSWESQPTRAAGASPQSPRLDPTPREAGCDTLSMDPAAAFAAFVSALTLMLQEVRRRGLPEARNQVRRALLDLEALVATWIVDADETNRLAAAYAQRLIAGHEPGGSTPADGLPAELDIQMFSQNRKGAAAQEVFGRRVPNWRGGEHGDVTLRELLRIYSPRLHWYAPLVAKRQELLRNGISWELDRSLRDGGEARVELYLAELSRTIDGLKAFHAELDRFIAGAFPL
jgi:hypothetical protein